MNTVPSERGGWVEAGLCEVDWLPKADITSQRNHTY